MEIVKDETPETKVEETKPQEKVVAERERTPLEHWQKFQEEQLMNYLVPNGWIKIKGYKGNVSNAQPTDQMIDSAIRVANNTFGKFYIEVAKKIDEEFDLINKTYQKLYEQRAPIGQSWWRRNVINRTLFNYLNEQIEIEQQKGNSLMGIKMFIVSITPKVRKKEAEKKPE